MILLYDVDDVISHGILQVIVNLIICVYLFLYDISTWQHHSPKKIDNLLLLDKNKVNIYLNAGGNIWINITDINPAGCSIYFC